MQQEAAGEQSTLVTLWKAPLRTLPTFGAFIDLGGADGLLHISEMSWGRVEHPKKVFARPAMQVKGSDQGDLRNQYCTLGMKFEDENPWKDAATKFAVGNVGNR